MKRPMDYLAIREFVDRTCFLLDESEYEGWLALCDAEKFRYTITAYSTEIAREMVWLDHDVTGLKTIFAGLAQHVSVGGFFQRHVGKLRISAIDDERASAVSSISVYHTDHRGASKLFALARYEDTVGNSAHGLTLISRKVQMDTRQLSLGPHVIL